jgi:hypothetical protein
MALALRISALFSRPGYHVLNIPKRALRLILEALVGSTEHWRGKFNGILPLLLAIAEHRILRVRVSSAALYGGSRLHYENCISCGRVIRKYRGREDPHTVTAADLRMGWYYCGHAGVCKFRHIELKQLFFIQRIYATVPNLKKQCKANGLTGYSRLRKAELLELLMAL